MAIQEWTNQTPGTIKLSETDHQQAVVQYFRQQYPEYLIYAVPNGAWLHGTSLQRIKQMKKLKAEGLEPGVPDLCIPVPRGKYHGLYIEMKDVGKTESDLSKEQKQKIIYLTWQGYKAEWRAGVDAAIELIDWYMGLKCL